MTSPMPPDEARDKMLEIITKMGTEEGHIRADDLMCQILKEHGYDEMVALFIAEDWWYA